MRDFKTSHPSPPSLKHMNMETNQALNGAHAQAPAQQNTAKAPYQAPTVQILSSSDTMGGKQPNAVETEWGDFGGVS
jgi:hypothetical protein